jgi:AcrR family transcriptional regulator
MPREYRMGKRQPSVDRTRRAILAAARDELASGEPGLTAAAVASRAGVSRITVYNRFGSKAGLLRELAAEARRERQPAHAGGDPVEELRRRIVDSCAMWASDPALFRRLPSAANIEVEPPSDDRALAERLVISGRLRPGCSLKEAEDVIGALTSFAVFDRVHRDGRRSTAAVAEILMRLAAGILAS